MTVGLLLLDCHISESQSLKDKRRVLTSVTERLQHQFNIAACEVDYQDQWQRALLAIVTVNTDWRMLQGSFSKITEWLDRDRRLDIVGTEVRQLC